MEETRLRSCHPPFGRGQQQRLGSHLRALAFRLWLRVQTPRAFAKTSRKKGREGLRHPPGNSRNQRAHARKSDSSNIEVAQSPVRSDQRQLRRVPRSHKSQGFESIRNGAVVWRRTLLIQAGGALGQQMEISAGLGQGIPWPLARGETR